MRIPFLAAERLREEAGHRTEVVVRVVNEVRVELDLAVVEVEVGRLGKVAIGLRIIAPIHLCHQALNFTSRWERNYMLLALNLIWQHPPFGETRTRRGQAVSPQHNTLLETVVSMTLVVIVEMIEFGDSNPWTTVH